MTTFVLVPGAGGEAWYWHPVEPLLRERGYDVVAVDLPADDERAGLADYADVIVDAAAGRSDIVLAAQSMGAFSAPLACDRLDVRQLVLVAPMIPAPGETGGEWWTATGQVAAQREQDVAAGRDPDAPFDVVELFMHDVPQELVDAALARGERDQSDRPFGEPWPLDAWPDVPTRVIAGRHDRLFPLAFLTRLSEDRLGVTPDVVDSGHLPALSRPRGLAELLHGAAGERLARPRVPDVGGSAI